MNELQDFNLDDLYDKLHLTDDEFDQWLASIGLLHGSMDCICETKKDCICETSKGNKKYMNFRKILEKNFFIFLSSIDVHPL